jgi:hypothetical protein
MAAQVYQLKATIIGTKPPVWRRLLVPGNTTLLSLHEILQAAFGWYGCHLHEFRINGVEYGTDDGEGWGPPPKNERTTRLRAVVAAGSAFQYVYDFGDDWRHKVVVEKVISAQPGVTYPSCVGGHRAGPPEDCGGAWGYEEFLVAIADPHHPQHDSMLEWVGGSFDPDAFDPRDFNQQLEVGSLAF